MSEPADPAQPAQAAQPPATPTPTTPTTPTPTIYCFWCGSQTEDQTAGAPMTWSLISTDERGPQLLCPACTRSNLRSIESQLDTDWW